ncbi:MAG: D-alanyl-D-alanine carboxypeptidase family protein [Clostridia bacterium]|nr:D-alanyl-D-alanine carboxypeptidase family protein [Clostridia bacterium]
MNNNRPPSGQYRGGQQGNPPNRNTGAQRPYNPQQGQPHAQQPRGQSRQGQYTRNPNPQPRGQANGQYSRPGAPARPNSGTSPNGAARPNVGGMSRINQQSPGKRRAQPKKIKLTAEQIEINRINRQRERYYIKKSREAAFRVFLSRLLLFLVVFAIMCGLTAALFFMQLTRQDSPDDSSYSYTIGDARSYRLAYSDAVRDGRIYVSFTDIAEMCDLAVTGSVDDIKYVIKGDEAETIRFLTGTRVVYVNTVETRLGAESYYKNDKLYVPVDFVSAYFKGLAVDVDEKKHEVTVTREILNELDEDGKVPKDEEIIYGELAFLLQSPAPIESINEADAVSVASMPDLGFVSNLAAYEEYMNPGNTTEYLTLVNVDHKLGASDVPQDLIVVANTRADGRAQQQMRNIAAKALEALFKEMVAATGFTDVTVTSAYRSYSQQEYNFNTRLSSYTNLSYEEAYKITAQVINPPGASEHQLGLVADMHNLAAADVSFGETEQFKWLKENCWKFGFILRYPEDKVDITGISYEPWHYRYVGRYHAQQMYEMNMCLEEYWDYLGLE